MAVQVNRDVDRFLEAADEFEGHVGIDQPRHILDADRMGAHVLDLLAQVYPQINRVHGAYRERHCALGVFADLECGLDRHLEIAHIVERIEYAEDVDTVRRSALHEFFDQVVGIMPVAEYVLPAKQHLLWRIRHRRFQLPNPLPGVFAEIADAGVESGAAPRLDGPEAHFVELRGNRQHVVDTHPGGQQRLMRVAQRKFGNPKWFHIAHFPEPVTCTQDRRSRR